ncbi:hypothetical protein A7K91_05755 [Paenibacillus oryzae]|uniref:Transcription factor zinc-finger domain-containing protein n=1 Tax=Paenibacillus oryzae TaxID=1844972 RepID=A0A1A5YHN8_9BACL|nr:hypothetical protein A7K91_05755 [Paenibacillus oryzae]
MKCPVCDDVRMREVVKDDVLIDVCPDCKGVWLDRGELEKLMQGVREVRDDYERLERQAYEPFPQGSPGAGNPYNAPSKQPQGSSYPNQSPVFGQAPPNAGYPQGGSGNEGYGQEYYGKGQYRNDKYGGQGKYGYDKYGRPKKKKNMLDVLGDLFD